MRFLIVLLLLKMSDCYLCKQKSNYRSVCDNDCGTIHCDKCKKSYYYDPRDQKVHQGHTPWCGYENGAIEKASNSYWYIINK